MRDIDNSSSSATNLDELRSDSKALLRHILMKYVDKEDVNTVSFPDLIFSYRIIKAS
jgi:hypothetical protein